MDISKATPRPWALEASNKDFDARDGKRWILRGANREIILICNRHGDNEASLPLIVIAVNQHQELLDLIRDMLGWMAVPVRHRHPDCIVLGMDTSKDCDFKVLRNRARKVLEAVEE